MEISFTDNNKYVQIIRFWNKEKKKWEEGKTGKTKLLKVIHTKAR